MAKVTPRTRMAALVAYLDEAEGSILYLDALYDASGKNNGDCDEWTVRMEIADLGEYARAIATQIV